MSFHGINDPFPYLQTFRYLAVAEM